MATIEKIDKEIARTKERISELQGKVKKLEAQKKEAANLEIVNLVKAVKMETPVLTVLLKAYAKGDIELPEEYAEELNTDETSYTEPEETEDEE